MLSLKQIRNACWVVFVCWACTIFVLSSISGKKIDALMPPFWSADKVIHALAFGAGAVILGMALRRTLSLSRLTLAVATIVCISVFGATDEYHQKWTPGRSACDVWDWLADTTGATFATFLLTYGKRPSATTGCGITARNREA